MDRSNTSGDIYTAFSNVTLTAAQPQAALAAVTLDIEQRVKGSQLIIAINIANSRKITPATIGLKS